MNNAQRMNRRMRDELPRIEVGNVVEIGMTLLVSMLYMYQIHQQHEHIIGELRDERVGQLLGHRWDLGTSNIAGEADLNETSLVGEKHDDDDEWNFAEEYHRYETDDEGEESSSSSEGKHDDDHHLKRRSFRKFRAKEGKVEGEKVEQNEANTSISTVKWVQKLKSVEWSNRTEEGFLVNSLGAVVLKSVAERSEVFRFNDETGVSKHDTAPSSSRSSNISSSGINDSSKCQKLCVQNVTDKRSLSLSEANNTVDDESGKESMRELLQEEM